MMHFHHKKNGYSFFVFFYLPSAMHARRATLLALTPVKMNILLPAFLKPAEIPS